MRKYIKIFLFMFLLTITVMTTSCGIKNINNSTNKGEIVVENNSNYESITVCGVINGSDILGGMGDMGNMTGGNTQNTTTSSLKKDDTQSDTQSDTPTDTQTPDMSSMSMQLVGTVENCTNTANLSVNNNTYELEETELLIEISGIVNDCEEVKDCKNEGKFTTDGNASQYKVETYDITKEKEEKK